MEQTDRQSQPSFVITEFTLCTFAMTDFERLTGGYNLKTCD